MIRRVRMFGWLCHRCGLFLGSFPFSGMGRYAFEEVNTAHTTRHTMKFLFFKLLILFL
jgi:hypothetical protein